MTVLTREQKEQLYKSIRDHFLVHPIEHREQRISENWREKQRKEFETEFVDDQGQGFSAEDADLSPEELDQLDRDRIKYKTYRDSSGIAGGGFSEGVIDFQYDAFNALFYADIAKNTYSLLAPQFVKDLGQKQGKRVAAATVGFMAKNGIGNLFAKGATTAAFRGFLGGTATVLGLGSGFVLPLAIGIVGPIVIDKALEWLVVEKDVFGVRGGIGHSNPHRQKYEKMLKNLRSQNKRYYAPVDKNYEADFWDLWPVPVQKRWCETGDGGKPFVRRDKGIRAEGPECEEVYQAYSNMANSFAKVQVEFENYKEVVGTKKAIEYMTEDFPHLPFDEEGIDMSEAAFSEATVNAELFSVSKLDSMVQVLEGNEEVEVDISPESEPETDEEDQALGQEPDGARTAAAIAAATAAIKSFPASKKIILKKIKSHRLERRQRMQAKKTKLTMNQIRKNLKDHFPKGTYKSKSGAYTPELFYAISRFQKENEKKLRAMGAKKPVTGIYDEKTHRLWLSMNKKANTKPKSVEK